MSAASSLGFSGRLRRLASSAVGLLACRVDLFATELEEDLLRLGAGLIQLLLAALFFAFAMLAGLALVTVLLWDSHRLLALAFCTVIFFGAFVWCALNAARRLNRDRPFLADTLAEFRRDHEALADDDA